MEHWEIPTAEKCRRGGGSAAATLWKEPEKQATWEPSPLEETLKVPSATRVSPALCSRALQYLQSAHDGGLASVASWICSSGWQSQIKR